ncbi:PorT family protein [Mucilaginibacter sp. JRF]|uniref:porin family protein n=1 Tax=Mucilaginibacter sp. JRF TaxID=2780088 RepID=UPI00187E66BC|nr:porin family protein [Mucilaginibacter sp. JRF]MBE9585195.1 PorT family protein [Mucilaginibacter sp. JRF]
MKFLFKMVLALVCLCSSASAQTKNSNEFGVQFGMNASSSKLGIMDETHYRVGFNAGVSIDHYFSESWSIKAKVLYDQKSWEGPSLLMRGALYGAQYDFNYLTIPVLANWHFGRTKNWYLNLGPYTSILLNVEEVGSDRDVRSALNDLDLGIGIKIPLSNRAKLFFELNGEKGLNNIVNEGSGAIDPQ